VSKHSKSRRLLIVPDLHAPFHDRKAFHALLRAGKEWKPDILVTLGDFLDCADVSFHDKSPQRKYTFKEEVESGNICLSALDDLGASEKVFVFGNHEHRLERFIARNAPQLDGMVSLEKELHLRSRGWKSVPYMTHTKIGKLHITHDCGNAGPSAHIKALHTFGGNIVIGHTHRMAVHYEGNARGEQHVGAMLGWLGDIESIDYMHRVRSNAWTLGFGTGIMLPSGDVHITGHPIVNGKVRLGGVVL
jgi:predicted MPP superfamily phosphohydrolase